MRCPAGAQPIPLTATVIAKTVLFSEPTRMRHRAGRSSLVGHFIDRRAVRPDIDARYPALFKAAAMRHHHHSLMCDMRSRMPHRCVSAATGVCC